MFVFKKRAAITFLLVLAPSCLCLFGLSRAPGQEANATPQAKQKIDEKTIRALIAQLGDDSFEKREEAEKKLIAVGKPALALLNKAATESKDAEVLDRTANVLKAIRRERRGYLVCRFTRGQPFRHRFQQGWPKHRGCLR